MWRRVPYLLVGLSLTACAAATPPARPFVGSAGREVLTAAEIVAARVTDVYQAVSQLRPEFLRRRLSVAPITPFAQPAVVVYLDEMPFGTAESLRHIPLDRVRVVQFITPSDANLKWGGTHPGGAILVTTLARR